MSRLTVQGPGKQVLSLGYTDQGYGPPIVLVHGWPFDQRWWEPQVTAFAAEGHRVITFDRRGAGSSDRPWEGYSNDIFAADLHALLETLDLTGAVIVGYSSGAAELARYVARHGTGRVSRLVFASALPPAFRSANGVQPHGITPGALDDLAAAWTRHRIVMLDQFTVAAFSVDGMLEIDEPTRLHCLRIAADASPKATVDGLRAWAESDARADLRHVDVPALVLHGAGDAIAPYPDSGRHYAAAIPGSSTTLIPNAPHAITLTHPDQWNQAVLDFLS